ncbi:glycine cleavage system protein T [Denitratisoma sp. DHT3]|uniref:glycine cleavage system aminomethyltransferase GcvT n=1 Tax=Denitratisoma sp. DHT3 TaxID=1981880 RepID=UPI001198B7E5|nr:glycine cleavage system aminomethyltransferase GcvT [Denitratisoma sp. DHT3]QDX80788.1 glycine cleavage system protein T [Denitratisoma sp. DHT3]
MSQRTALHQTHLDAGARIVDFAGWDMPIHYGSQIEEHHAVRRAAGMFDVSHMLSIDLAGADATPYLRRLLANDCAKLQAQPGKALYSCMLREDGGVIDDLIVYFLAPDRYRIVVNAGTADKDVAWMQAQADGFAVTLTPRRDLAMIAVQGPQAREKFFAAYPAARPVAEALAPFQGAEWSAAPQNAEGAWFIGRTGYTGEDGFEIALPATQAAAAWAALAAAGVAPCGLGARDTLRLEAGMNLYGQDMDESQNPLESGLAWTVDFKDADRDFIGRRALAALTPGRRLAGLVLLDRGVLRAHQKVHTAAGDGETTSGTFSPTLERSIALARIPAHVENGAEVEVEIRDKRLRAKVVKPPFVRNGSALV